jgi:hypothetical protein
MLCFQLAFVIFNFSYLERNLTLFCCGRKSGAEIWTEAYRPRTEMCGFVEPIHIYLYLCLFSTLIPQYANNRLYITIYCCI